ncbi:MAG: type II toxin-antitoxin system RelE/ParE family toxin [Bryobacteraceae bacterium]
MRLRWTAPAAQDLYEIARYVRRDNPAVARKVAKKLYDGCESLTTNPLRGRKGRIEGTRELIFPNLPYIAVYRVIDDTVGLMHFYHAARNWP